MKHQMLFLSSLLTSALSNPINNNALLYERATPTVPEATPTGLICLGKASPPPLTKAEEAKALAGCKGVVIDPAGASRNDILDGICKPHSLIFARGTGENGTIGNIVGPPFVVALDAVFGKDNLAVQGVTDYPAVPADFCAGGSLSGGKELAKLIKLTQSQCPETKLTISGYSQGAQVVHNAAELLASDSSATDFINSVVFFGDPDIGLPVGKVPASKVSEVCHKGDNICHGGEEVLEPHLSYCHNVAQEAAFVKKESEKCGWQG